MEIFLSLSEEDNVNMYSVYIYKSNYIYFILRIPEISCKSMQYPTQMDTRGSDILGTSSQSILMKREAHNPIANRVFPKEKT
jgi:hypothetical protein